MISSANTKLLFLDTMNRTITIFLILLLGLQYGVSDALGYNFIAWETLMLNITALVLFMKKYRKEQIICFELFFSIIFLIITYSLYFVSLDEVAGYGANLVIDFLSVTGLTYYKKATLLSSIGYLSFMYGSSMPYAKNRLVSTRTPIRYNKKIEFIFLSLSVITFSLFMIYDYEDFKALYTDTPDNYHVSYVMWFTMMYITYMVVCFRNASALGINKFKSLFKKMPLLIISFFSLEILFMSAGHRTQAIGFALPFAFLYSIYVSKLSGKKVFALCLIGFLFMVFIGQTRKGDVYEVSSLGEFVIDFTGPSTATPFFIQYVEQNGISWGTNYFIKLLAVIPFMAGLYVLFGLPYSPDSFIVFTGSFMNAGTGIGMGTSLIGDIYYTFGFPGVVLLMSLLGYIASNLYKQIVENKDISPYIIICFAVIMSQSYFMPRSDYMAFLRPIALQCLFYFIASIVVNSTGRKRIK